MTNTQIDHLLQLAVPRPESSLASDRSRDATPPFDHHFRQASAPTPTPAPSPTPQRPVASTSPSPQPVTRDDRPPKPPADSAAEPTDAPNSSVDPENVDEAVAVDQEAAADEPSTDDHSVAAVAITPVAQVAEPVTVEPVVAEHSLQPVADPNRPPTDSDAQPKTDANSTVETDVPSDSPTEIRQAVRDVATPVEAAPSDHAAKAVVIEPKPVELGAVQHIAADQVEPQLPTTTTETTESLEAAATPADEKVSPRTKSKPAKADHDKQSPAEVDHAIQDQPRARAAATAQSGAVAAVASTNGLSHAEVAASSTKDEQKTDAPAETAAENQSAPSRERPTTTGRAAAAAVPFAVIQSQAARDAASSAAADSDAKPPETKPVAKDAFLSPLARLDRAVHRGTHRADSADTKPPVDPARFVNRVARAIHTAQERGAPLQLRLSPPELGAMRLELTVHQGALTAQIETENATTKQLLLDHLPALRDRLAEQNIRIERFDVDVRRDGQSSTGQQDNFASHHRSHDRHHEPNSPHRNPTNRNTANSTTTEDPTPIRRTITNTSINLII